MGEPFDPETARTYILAILDGSGMTVFTKRMKDEALNHDMTSLDAVNILRGGRLSTIAQAPCGWRYQAATRLMSVEFSFRGQAHDASAPPSELVIESARRNK